MAFLFQSPGVMLPGICCKSGLVIRRALDPSLGGKILAFFVAFVTTRGRTGMTGRQSVPEGPAASDPLLGSWLVPSSLFSS